MSDAEENCSAGSPHRSPEELEIQRQLELEIERELAAASSGGAAPLPNAGDLFSNISASLPTQSVAHFDPFAEFSVPQPHTAEPGESEHDESYQPEAMALTRREQEMAEAVRQQEAMALARREQEMAEAVRQQEAMALARREQEMAEAVRQQEAMAEEARLKREEDLAIEREVQRRIAEQQEKEEAARREVAEREVQRRLQEAEAAARAAAEQQAKIEAAVAERLRKAKEEADEKRRQREAEEEIERRVAEALARQAEQQREEDARRAEEKRKEDERISAELQRRAMEEEIERRVAAAAEARIQSALAAAGVTAAAPALTAAAPALAAAAGAFLDGGPLTPTPKPVLDRPTATPSPSENSTHDAEEASDVSFEGSSDGPEEDLTSAAPEVSRQHPSFTGNSVSGTLSAAEFLDAALLENKNASLALVPQESDDEIASRVRRNAEGVTASSWSLASAADLLSFESALAAEKRDALISSTPLHDFHKERLCVQRYATQREAGRCVAPAAESDLINKKSTNHTTIQLGFFGAEQVIVSCPPRPSKIHVACRESQASDAARPNGKPIRLLSQSHFTFEADILKDPAVTADAEEEEDYAHNSHDECLISSDDVRRDPHKAVCTATGAFSYGDPIQVFERARGRRFELPKPSGAPTSPVPPPMMTTTTGSTTGKLWVHDVDTRKPVPATSMFTGGVMLQFDIDKIESQVDALHGAGTDPTFLSAAVYCIHTTQTIAVTDTFYFDSHAFAFLPHRQPQQVHRSFVAFVPNEFKSAPLFLCIRVHRLATEDQDSYVDMYARPDRYKTHHVVPMKQETQQLAMHSEIMEELGWVMMSVNENNDKLAKKALQCDKIFRGTKTNSDEHMMKLVMDHRVRGSLKTIQFSIHITMTNITTHEFSFPDKNPIQAPEINESVIEHLDPDVPNATRQTARYAPCCLPILNAGHFHGYHNILYLRLHMLRCINLSSVKYPSGSHYNFVVQVALKDNDDSLAEEGTRAIFTKWLGEGTLQTSSFSSTYHYAKEFECADEFKVQLPLHLSEKHHLFFTVYAVSFKKPAPNAKEPRLFKIGYAAIPVLTKDNGNLFLKDSVDVQVISADHAEPALPGYLEKFPSVAPNNMFNNGTFAMKVGLYGRSSVYASNTTVSAFFKRLPPSLSEVVKDNEVLAVGGQLHKVVADGKDAPHLACLEKVGELPLPEIMAFYPLLTSYCLAVISSSSACVGVNVRLSAFRALAELTSKAHNYELSVRSLVNRRSGQKPPSTPYTCTVTLLYHYITNDVLFRGTNAHGGKHGSCKPFRLYMGVAETMAILLESTTGASTVVGKSDVAQLLSKLADLSWFYLDIVLRSLYLLRTQPAPDAAIDVPSLFGVLNRLVKEFLAKLAPIGGVMVIQRLAVFVRNLVHVCDRGYVLDLMANTLALLQAQAVPNNVQAAAKIFLDDEDVLVLLLPSTHSRVPSFLSSLIVEFVGPQLVHSVRDVRVTAASLLYTFTCRLVNSRRVSSAALSRIATQWLSLLSYLSENWQLYRQLTDPKTSTPAAGSAMADKRQLLALLMWITFNAPAEELRLWTRTVEHRVLGGFMCIVADAQAAFRYQYGKDKFLPDQQKLAPDVAETIAAWDARMSTFVCMIGCRVATNLVVDCRDALATVASDRGSPAVFPFFLMVESLLHFGSATIALQASAAVLHHVVDALMPEIMSRKGRMSSGVVLLAMRMVSGTPMWVRQIAVKTFELIAAHYYGLTGSLNKLKHHTANALIAVAESKVRDLRLAGAFVRRHLTDIVKAAQAQQEASVEFPLDVIGRYVEESAASSGDASVKYNYRVVPQFMSTSYKLSFPSYLTEPSSASATRPTYAADLTSMCEVMLSLFRDVLRLQMDSSMKFKETKGLAYYDVVQNFLRQNTLKEVLKWLARLHEACKSRSDNCEAGMALVFTAALGFRLTEAFYALKGDDCRGARLPVAVLTHVQWHDYVRVLPEVNTLIPLENVYGIVREMTVLPDEAPFTVEGQIKLMKEAAEFLDKNAYYELSMKAVSVVDKYLIAKGDYKGSAVVHNAMTTWANAIVQHSAKRPNFRYFLLWARMEREVSPAETALLKKLKKRKDGSDSDDDEADKKSNDASTDASFLSPIKLVYKQPAATSLSEFKNYAKEFVLSQFPFDALLHLTDEMLPTQQAVDVSALLSPNGKVTKAARAHMKTPNRCLLTVVEVTPTLDTASQFSKNSDRACTISRFEHVNRVGSEIVTKQGASRMTKSQHLSANLPKSEFDVLHQQLSVNVHYTERAFPSTTTAIPVRASEEELLDCFQTAIETMNAELDALEAAPDSASLAPLLHSLTPMNIVPPGTYYKAVVAAMSSNQEVIATVREVLRCCREKLAKCEEDSDAIQKSPETYALILKGLADVDCALIDVPLPVASTAQNDEMTTES